MAIENEEDFLQDISLAEEEEYGEVEYTKVTFLAFKMFHAEVFRKEVRFLVVVAAAVNLDHGSKTIDLVFQLILSTLLLFIVEGRCIV